MSSASEMRRPAGPSPHISQEARIKGTKIRGVPTGIDFFALLQGEYCGPKIGQERLSLSRRQTR
jgi:hypothetical protein